MEASNNIKFTSNIEMRQVYSFEEIPIRNEILEAIHNQNIVIKPVPQYTLDHILKNRHLLIISPSGLGRGFSTIIGILNTIKLSNPNTQALIISPTHSLANEFYNDINIYKGSLNISTVLCIGGTYIDYSTLRSQIIVGTCGKLLDLLQKQRIKLNQLKIIVCDIVNVLLINDKLREETEKILKFVSLQCIHWFLASKRIGSVVEENYRKRVGDKGIVEIGFDYSIFGCFKFFHKVVLSDEEQKDVVQGIASNLDKKSIIFSQDEDQLKNYKHRLIDLSPKLLTSHKSIEKKERILENFENEKYKLLLCSSRGTFLRRLNSKRPSKVIFLDIPKKWLFILRLQRFNFHIDDEIFFIINESENPLLLKRASTLGIKLNLL